MNLGTAEEIVYCEEVFAAMEAEFIRRGITIQRLSPSASAYGFCIEANIEASQRRRHLTVIRHDMYGVVTIRVYCGPYADSATCTVDPRTDFSNSIRELARTVLRRAQGGGRH